MAGKEMKDKDEEGFLKEVITEANGKDVRGKKMICFQISFSHQKTRVCAFLDGRGNFEKDERIKQRSQRIYFAISPTYSSASQLDFPFSQSIR